jgi:hypothetical protein
MPSDNINREGDLPAGSTGSQEAPRTDYQDIVGNEAAATPDMNNDPLAGALDQQSQGDTLEHAVTEDTGIAAKDEPTPPGGPASRDTSAPAGAPIGGATTPMGAVAGRGAPTCPPEFPVKADQGTLRFHVPGRRTYDQVIPTWCFENEAAALNAGYSAHEDDE